MLLPRNKEWFPKVVVDTNDEIIVSDCIDLGTRKLAIDQDPLQQIFFSTFNFLTMKQTSKHFHGIQTTPRKHSSKEESTCCLTPRG